VEIIDARSRRVLRFIRGHAGIVADVAFSPDGTRIATASRDETVRVSGRGQRFISVSTARSNHAACAMAA